MTSYALDCQACDSAHKLCKLGVQDLLTLELRWSSREGAYPDRLTVHRKGRPGQQEEEPLAHELRCWPNIPQVSPSSPTVSI